MKGVILKASERKAKDTQGSKVVHTPLQPTLSFLTKQGGWNNSEKENVMVHTYAQEDNNVWMES